MTEFQRNLNASNTDLGSNCNSNSNILIFKVIVIYYLGGNSISDNYTDV